MRNLAEMGIIEIDITNACVHECSNCTRFCGHHKKPFFMSFEEFKKAVDSLDGFPGMAGVMGGEPTLHPEFERFLEYLREKRSNGHVTEARGPISDMQLHIMANANTGRLPGRSVLLSSLNNTYYKHFEAINDTFRYQLLNDHQNKVEHQALLMSRKELGIQDDEWIKKRDSCWIQNTWSASITPKGAFFCEVAGALDMLFDGPGGWKVEKDWWKRRPEEFGEQLKWCEFCSGCLDVPKRLSSEEVDDVTPEMYERLKQRQSPKLAKGNVAIRDPKIYETYRDPSYITGSEYIVDAGENQRTSIDNRALYPRDVKIIDRKQSEDKVEVAVNKDWILLSDSSDEKTLKYLFNHIWNPGCLYIIDGEKILFHVNASSIRDKYKNLEFTEKNLLDSYPPDKVIKLSLTDPLVEIMGGDTDEMMIQMGTRAEKKLLVYGAGMIARMAIKKLDDIGIADYEVVVTDKSQNANEILGHEIHQLSEYMENQEKYIVLMAATPIIREDMESKLREYGFKNYRTIA